MIRIASIDNLSARTFRLETPDFAHSLRFETPARVHALMAAGHCDAALLPVASLPVLKGAIQTAGDFGIACTGPVRSVQLFSPTAIGELLSKGAPIYVTTKSKTSVALFDLLCRREHGESPNLTSSYSDASARLLIGDAAFEFAQRHGTGTHNIDLGGWWLAQTGLPFVFARWVVSNSLGASRKAQVVAWLERCATAVATEMGRESLLDGLDYAPEDRLALQVYYQRLRAHLSISDIAGQACFLQLLERSSHARTAPVA